MHLRFFVFFLKKFFMDESKSVSCSVVSNSLRPHGLWPTRFLHGISQTRILEWVAFPFSRKSSRSRDQTQISSITGGFFTIWATREALFMDTGSKSSYLQNLWYVIHVIDKETGLSDLSIVTQPPKCYPLEAHEDHFSYLEKVYKVSFISLPC